MSATPVIQIGPDLPGLRGVPEFIGPVRCPDCEDTATVHHVPAGEGEFTPTLICPCGSIFELEATAYSVGLAAGVLAQMAKTSPDPIPQSPPPPLPPPHPFQR
jgi:hypothetical protein